ncbi:hypothetical protein EJ08DRAFT_662359 [Tothia fuscella]|uniref:Uncharacterized protein n=1 Tax=Tothia fuscella TaxID=1048955 RepID=A0A9P4TXE4_9PEZI|nr:hypothetical protein EJ08DRAFT_662359 [Tothia fuscella]
MNGLSNWPQFVILEPKSLNVEHLVFRESALGYSNLRLLVFGIKSLKTFDYEGNDADLRRSNLHFQPQQLLSILSQHKHCLEKLVLSDLRSVTEWVGRTEDITIGPLAEFSNLKVVGIDQQFLLGALRQRECDNCVRDGRNCWLEGHEIDNALHDYTLEICRRCDKYNWQGCHFQLKQLTSLCEVLPSSLEVLYLHQCTTEILSQLRDFAVVRKERFPCFKRLHVESIFDTGNEIEEIFQNDLGVKVECIVDVHKEGRYWAHRKWHENE